MGGGGVHPKRGDKDFFSCTGKISNRFKTEFFLPIFLEGADIFYHTIDDTFTNTPEPDYGTNTFTINAHTFATLPMAQFILAISLNTDFHDTGVKPVNGQNAS